MTRRTIITKAAIKRAIDAVRDAGLTVTGVYVEGGKIEVLTVEQHGSQRRLAKHANVRL